MERNAHRVVRYLGHPASLSKARKRAGRAAGEDGVAMTEFALVLPLLMLLLLGILDFGKAFNYWLDETDIAHQGARFAAVNRNPATGQGLGFVGATPTFQDYLRQQADTGELQAGLRICVSFPNTTWNVGDPVEVTATTDYVWLEFISGVLTDIFGSPVFQTSLTGSATMRLEQRPTNATQLLDDNHTGC